MVRQKTAEGLVDRRSGDRCMSRPDRGQPRNESGCQLVGVFIVVDRQGHWRGRRISGRDVKDAITHLTHSPRVQARPQVLGHRVRDVQHRTSFELS